MNTYQSPFTDRYASPEMRRIFSPQYKYSTWRKLWVILAQGLKKLGLPVSKEQVEELSAHIEVINWKKAAEYEKRFQHDVVAHIRAYADQCPKAAPIIHLGATSCYVTDNTDIIQMKEGLNLLQGKLAKAIEALSKFARLHAALPCLAYTHLQPAQPTTVGKRACMWIQDLLIDLQEFQTRLSALKFLGTKGATGTQASFLELFQGDSEKVKKLDQFVTSQIGFGKCFLISGQTYTRKQDMQALQALAGLAASTHKIGTDIRLLAHLKEIEEPFAEEQIGSSAMPYKRNPILSERLCALSRYLISLSENPSYTAATQWLERTLDDSANRRLCIPEAFLCSDAILDILIQLSTGLQVNKGIIKKHLEEELPFIATENILMAGVKKGGDRQVLHSKLRLHCQAASLQIKNKGVPNDLIERLAADKSFTLTAKDLAAFTDGKNFIGRSAEQVEEFWQNEVQPALRF